MIQTKLFFLLIYSPTEVSASARRSLCSSLGVYFPILASSIAWHVCCDFANSALAPVIFFSGFGRHRRFTDFSLLIEISLEISFTLLNVSIIFPLTEGNALPQLGPSGLFEIEIKIKMDDECKC